MIKLNNNINYKDEYLILCFANSNVKQDNLYKKSDSGEFCQTILPFYIMGYRPDLSGHLLEKIRLLFKVHNNSNFKANGAFVTKVLYDSLLGIPFRNILIPFIRILFVNTSFAFFLLLNPGK